MARLLKIAVFGLVGFIALTEVRSDTHHLGLGGHGHDAGAIAGTIAKSAAVGAAVASANNAAGVGVGTGGIGGGLGGLGGGAGAGIGGLGGGVGGAGAGIGGGAGGNHRNSGGKVVIDINKTNANAGCKCGNPQLDEFGHNLSLALRAYTSKELVPELKKVAAKFVDYVMGYLAREKPDEIASVHNFLQNSAAVTGNARAGNLGGGIGGGAVGGATGVAVGGASARVL